RQRHGRRQQWNRNGCFRWYSQRDADPDRRAGKGLGTLLAYRNGQRRGPGCFSGWGSHLGVTDQAAPGARDRSRVGGGSHQGRGGRGGRLQHGGGGEQVIAAVSPGAADILRAAAPDKGARTESAAPLGLQPGANPTATTLSSSGVGAVSAGGTANGTTISSGG